MEDCVFCKIIDGQIPAHKVYEDDKTVAFLDIAPVNKGHMLVIPKKHSKNILEDDLEDLKACIATVQKIAHAVLKATNADGFNLGVNTNRAAGQAVFHTHFHVIPRFEDDGLRLWPQRKSTDEEMKTTQEAIIGALS